MSTELDPKKKLNEEDAAKFLGIGRSTLRRLRSNGLIGFFRYSSKAFYSIEQLQAYQNRHEVRPLTGKSRGKSFGNLRLA